jgi:type II secretory pathway component PulJ
MTSRISAPVALAMSLLSGFAYAANSAAIPADKSVTQHGQKQATILQASALLGKRNTRQGDPGVNPTPIGGSGGGVHGSPQL